MKRYPAYKDSGVEWLGEVPEGWTVAAPKYFLSNRSGGTAIKGQCPSEPEEGLYQAYSASGPDVWLEEYHHATPGLVLSAVGARCGKTFKADGKWGTVANTHCLLPYPNADRDFLWYLTNDESWWEKGGTAQPFVSVKQTLDRPWVFPSLLEQHAIAGFLDREVGKIDALVQEQRRLIALLAEKRQSVISHAVTRGLNPATPLKPSGIDWLGDIPEGWEVVPLKHLVSHVVDCLHTTPHYDGEVEFPAVRTADVEPGILLVEQIRRVSREVYLERIQRLKPEANDILYSREGERLGMAALVPEETQLCLGQRMMMFRCLSDQNPRFIMWALNSQSIYQQVVEKNLGSTSPHVNISDIINFRMAVPPLGMQRSIADFIDTQTAQLDALTTAATSAIALLQERRAALISAAVTGKIDLRDISSQSLSEPEHA